MSWRERLIEERDQLGERLAKLRDFFRNEDLDNFPYAAVGLMREQEMHMAGYLEVLNRRIDILEPPTD